MGKVYFIGGGPGDPELLTIKAARILSEARVVVYDKGLEGLLPLINPGALRVLAQSLGPSVGKVLAHYAESYDVVVRLKVGDPLVFSRFLDEVEPLREVGVDYEVVPGVSSITAALSAIKEPLTIRGRPVAMVSGHAVSAELCGILSRMDAVILMPLDPCGIVRVCGLEDCTATILERLTMPDERVYVAACLELCRLEVNKPAIIMIRHGK